MIHDNVLGKRYAVLYLHKILRKCVKEKYKCLARVVQFSLFNPDVVGRLPSVDKLLSACWASQSGSLPSMQGQLASLSSHSQNLACLSFWCIGNSGLLHGPLLERDCLAGWSRCLAVIGMIFFCIISFGDDLHLLRFLVVPHVILIFIVGSKSI